MQSSLKEKNVSNGKITVKLLAGVKNDGNKFDLPYFMTGTPWVS